MVVYDERNNRLEIIRFLENRKCFIPCVGIDPRTERVVSADAFGDEVRVRVEPRAGHGMGRMAVRLVKYSLAQASDDPGAQKVQGAPAVAPRNPFASRDPAPRFAFPAQPSIR